MSEVMVYFAFLFGKNPKNKYEKTMKNIIYIRIHTIKKTILYYINNTKLNSLKKN